MHHRITAAATAATILIAAVAFTATGCANPAVSDRGTASAPPTRAAIAGDEGSLFKNPTAKQTRALQRAASDAVRAYLDRDNPTWFDDLRPFLTTDAADAYATVDVRNLPDAHVTGAATVEVSPDPTHRTAHVRTSVGTYDVDLVRLTENTPWKADRLYPPSNLPGRR